jgi:ABC-type sugar transport system substrate-binding protein
MSTGSVTNRPPAFNLHAGLMPAQAKSLLLDAAASGNVNMIENLNEDLPLSCIEEDDVMEVIEKAAANGHAAFVIKFIALFNPQDTDPYFLRALEVARKAGKESTVQELVQVADPW